MHFKNKTVLRPGFTLVEILVALVIFALLATPLIMTQSTILGGVARNAWHVQRMIAAQNFFVDGRQAAHTAPEFTLEKKIASPEAYLRYVRAPVAQGSLAVGYKGLLCEKVTVEWQEMGQKKSDTLVQFIFKPEPKES